MKTKAMLAEETKDLDHVNYPCQAEPNLYITIYSGRMDGRRVIIEIDDGNPVKIYDRSGDDVTADNPHNQAVASSLMPQLTMEFRKTAIV